MIKNLFFSALISGVCMMTTALHAAEGWIIKSSPHSVSQTADNFVSAVEKAGATLFARVDHQAGAEKVGATLPGATLIIFGNPKMGTPIMQSNLKAGLDLPVRVLIWEENGTTQLGAISPDTLKARYGISGADGPFATMSGALEKLMSAAAQ